MSLAQAIALHQQGRLAEAEALYRRVMEQGPADARAFSYLGAICMRQGRFAEAAELLQGALRLQGDDVAVLVNLGMSLRHLGRPGDARPLLARACALKPDLAEAHHQHALALAETGHAEEGMAAAAQAIALQADHADAHFLRALLLADLGRKDEAGAAYDRLLALAPDHVEALNNRALLAGGAQNIDAALRDLDRAVTLQPGHVPSLTNRALVLGDNGRTADALADYDRLVALAPNDAELWNRRGAMLRALGRNSEALQSFETALRLKPDFATALANRGFLRWLAEGRYAEAKADLVRALRLEPGQPWLQGELFYLAMQGADWVDYAAGRAALTAAVAAGALAVRPFAWAAVSADPASLQHCARIAAKAELAELPVPAAMAARATTRLRIGYVSADFREQATAYLMAGVYEAHDRKAFEIIAFDNGPDDASPMRARLMAAFDRHVPIASLSDAAAAQAVREANIDILVNLNGWFGKPRTGLFAGRPAPLQVNYLGFPGTLGADFMDYIIADRIVIPDGEQRFFDEAVVWMPDSYQANDNRRARPAPTSRAEAGLPADAFVFCNFNQSYKLAPETFAVWMRLLQRCPGSVLWLLRDHNVVMTHLRAAAMAAGVAPERVIFAPLKPLEAHLSRLALADLFVDSLPYNAHTTASDALWSGVPLLTCRGTAFAGRVGASLLSAAGLPELITTDIGAYEDLAVALASDRERLGALKVKLAQGRKSCALFDTARFTRHLESAYRIMHARHLSGAAPEGFAVPLL